jgi:3-phenylpropionate/trans-cinnamate dioxygenase ferredoxin reductase subunit
MTVVIVGAGQAGARAAEALRLARYDGRVVMVGEEQHLPYDRPPLSKGVLLGRQDSAIATLLDRRFYDNNAIELRLGVRVVRIRRDDKAIDLADGSVIPYTQLILATGLRSRPLRGFALRDRLFHLRTLDDAGRLRQAMRSGQRLLVIGGGLLGLEIAATARQIGCEVVVVERHPTLLYQSVAPVVGDHVTRLHHGRGVRILTGATPRRMHLVPAVPDRETYDGGQAAREPATVVTELSNGETLTSDVVVAATGSIVNSELAEACGLEVQDGIIVDQFGRSSDPVIFAVGDVARHFNPLLGRTIRVESWHNAQHQSAAIAQVVAGSQTPYAEVPWFWSDQYDMNLQTVGYSSDWDRVIVRGDPAGRRFTVLYMQGNRLVAANMVNNGRDLRAARECIVGHTALNLDRLAHAAGGLEDAVLSASGSAGSAG